MKEKKPSKDELLDTMADCEKMFVSRLHALYPSYRHKALNTEFKRKTKQIRQLIEVRAEPSEAGDDDYQ